MSGPTDAIALETGANKGIGYEVARGIAKAGYVVLLGARNPTTGREAADSVRNERLDVRFVELDLTRRETISAAAGRIEAEFGKLDVLINNAGIAVNSVNPGFTATDLNAHRGHQTVAEGAGEIVRVALRENGPSGKFLEAGGELVW